MEALEAVGRRFANVELVLLGTGFNVAMVPAFENIRVRTIPRYDQATMWTSLCLRHRVVPTLENEMSLGRER